MFHSARPIRRENHLVVLSERLRHLGLPFLIIIDDQNRWLVIHSRLLRRLMITKRGGGLEIRFLYRVCCSLRFCRGALLQSASCGKGRCLILSLLSSGTVETTISQ